jgi:hypothetical protein
MPADTPVEPAQKPGTSVKRNRCRLDEVQQEYQLNVDVCPKFPPEIVLEIVKDHWKLPFCVPSSFPRDYPPKAPLLDVDLPTAVADDLGRAFTLNSVTYAVKGSKGNLVLEMLGDKYMGSMVALMVHRDLIKHQQESVYSGLDLGGLDVSHDHC